MHLHVIGRGSKHGALARSFSRRRFWGFRLALMGRRDDFVDCSGHSRTWLSRNSRGIQNRFHYSCGLGHARLRHFLLDAGTCRVGAFFLTFLMPHAPIMISRWKPSSPLSHSC